MQELSWKSVISGFSVGKSRNCLRKPLDNGIEHCVRKGKMEDKR